MLDRIIPEKKACNAAIIVNPQTISVGNFLTCPVSQYAVITE